MDHPVALVQKLEIGNSFAGRKGDVLNRWHVVSLGLADNHDLIENIGGVGSQKRGSDGIARMKLGYHARILKRVGHRHRVHKAGDGFRIECDFGFRRIGRNYSASDVELFYGAVRGMSCRRRDCVTSGEPGQSSDNERRQKSGRKAHPRSVYT